MKVFAAVAAEFSAAGLIRLFPVWLKQDKEAFP